METTGVDAAETDYGLSLSKILFSSVVVSVLVYGVIKLSDPMTLPIRHVSINGDFRHISPASLESRASNVVRGGFFNVNVETIQEALREEPWIRDIMVRRIWPDRIAVDIKEQTAVARWKDDGLVNSESVVFFPDKSSFPDNLPYLSGPDNSAKLVLDHLYNFTEIVPEHLEIRELHLSDRRSWKMVLSNGLLLQIGKSEVMERARQFFNYYSILSLNDERKIDYVDLRYTNGFVIGWNIDSETELKNGQEGYGKKI